MSEHDTGDNLNDIAIIGMSARLPGAPDVDTFWRNLRDGVDSVQFLSDKPPVTRNGFAHIRAVSSMEGFEFFDAGLFGFNPREAETMDPQIRVFLECAWAALEDAGYDPKQCRVPIGVYTGSANSTYMTNNLLPNAEVMRASGGMFSSLGQFNDRDSLATIVSYKLDLSGPSITVQTFCSTSLVATHLACQALLSGETDMALAGGVAINVTSARGYVYQEGSILSPDGHCRSFDAMAGGTVFGNGVGAVVLKRASDALADGDTIHAIIKGTAINNDGAQKAGYTAPSVVGQSKAIAEAMAIAQVSPSTITYIEAHGTATDMGDPIEIEALTRAFRTGTDKTGFCAIGSVKTNFGHLDRAAGIAGLIKTVLALEHRQIPPSLHFESPNPKIDFDASPFYVNTGLAEWNSDKAPRRAGVSALGFGGTNAHVVLQEAPDTESSEPSRSPQLLVLSAKTEDGLDQVAQNLSKHLSTHPNVNLADVAYTLKLGRTRLEYRRAIVCEDVQNACAALDKPPSPQSFTTYSQETDRPVVFMCTGQGSQYINMTAGLYQTEPVYKKHLDACRDSLRSHVEFDLCDVIFATGDEATERLQQTAITQPVLFAVEYALAKLWMSWGVKPQALIGHSIGEYVAACLTGVLSLDDALMLVAERGKLMQSLPTGAMLVVPMSQDRVEPLLGDDLALAGVNGPALCVVSGPTGSIDKFEKRLTDEGIACSRLRTSHAFHSSMMDPILEPFTEHVRRVTLNAPRIPFISNFTGTWIKPEEATDPTYWANHLRGTVRFSEGIKTLWSQPDRILLEIGPGNTLSSLARQHAERGADQITVPCVRHPKESENDQTYMLGAVGKLWAAGAAMDWTRLYQNQRRRRISLPTYPFQRDRYWIEAEPQTSTAAQRTAVKNPDREHWFYVPGWKTAPPPQPKAKEKPATWLAFGCEPDLADGLRQRGCEVITVSPGDSFAGNPEEGYTLSPDSREQCGALLADLDKRGMTIANIVHAFSVTAPTNAKLDAVSFASEQRAGYYSLMALAQAIGDSNWTHPIELNVVTSGLHEVLRGDPIEPARSTILALCKVIPQEYHNIICMSIDLPLIDKQEPATLDTLVATMECHEVGTEFAIRGTQRWARMFEAMPIAASEGAPLALREGGVYLITGGLGGVGFALACYLAEQVSAKLILTGRTPLPPRDEWRNYLTTHPPADSTSLKIRRVHSLEALGAEVLVAVADAGELEPMRRTIEQGEKRFGPLNGIIHGAGIVGGKTFRPIREIGRDECEQQFHPKVAGVLVLEAILADKKLDFCLLTSSLSSVLGGFAYGAYAAGNIFLDAFTCRHNRTATTPWISVNWDEWHLADSTDSDAGTLAKMAMSPTEGADAFGRTLGLMGIDQIVVSTGDLQARIDQWIKLEALRELKKSSEKSTQAPRHARPNLQGAFVAPGTDTERKIAEIWQDLLGIEKVGIHDNFFELGGHSLLAIQLVSRMKTECDAEVSVATLFEGPTVASLGKIIDTDDSAAPSFDHSTDRGKRRKEKRRTRSRQRSGQPDE